MKKRREKDQEFNFLYNFNILLHIFLYSLLYNMFFSYFHPIHFIRTVWRSKKGKEEKEKHLKLNFLYNFHIFLRVLSLYFTLHYVFSYFHPVYFICTVWKSKERRKDAGRLKISLYIHSFHPYTVFLVFSVCFVKISVCLCMNGCTRAFWAYISLYVRVCVLGKAHVRFETCARVYM